MANDEYVKFSDRVRVVDEDQVRLLQVLTEEGWRTIDVEEPLEHFGVRTGHLESAMRLACEAVRERCAELVEAEYPSDVPYTMARYLADHIRGLEL